MAPELTAGTNNEQCAWLETLLKKYNNDKSIARIIDIDLKPAVKEGDNFASLISRATLSVILSSGCKTKKTVIFKKQHDVKDKVNALKELNVFETEIKVYKEILEKCEQLMDEYEDPGEKLWCNMIGYRPYNLVVLEDLKAQNFKVANRLNMLDLNHSLLVLNSLGRLHGLSHVLINKGLLVKSDLPPHCLETETVFITKLFTGCLAVLSKEIENNWSPEWKEAAKLILKEKDVFIEKSGKLFKNLENRLLTLCHGDCWTANMMFKYCPYNENIPMAFKFLDFQACSINSYIFDVIHFIYGNVQPHIRRENFERLLLEYQKSLKSTLSIYGMEESAPSIEEIHSDHKQIEYFELMINIFVLALSTSDVKDKLRIECCNENSDEMNVIKPEVYSADLFKKTFQTEWKDWVQKGFFQD